MRSFRTLARPTAWAWIVAGILAMSASAGAAELRIEDAKIFPNGSVQVPVVIQNVDDLCGLKMVVWYDQDRLKFSKFIKASEVRSFLHMVNDKVAGILVVSMAGAKGVGAEMLPICTLKFELKPTTGRQKITPFLVRESRLIGEALEEIAHEVTIGRFE